MPLAPVNPKENDLLSPPVLRSRFAKPVPRALEDGPLATPLVVLQVFEKSSQKLLAPHRFVRDLQALLLPPELTKLLDDLTVVLGSGTKAWAVVLQWLAAKLGEQITLSRQSERLLRHVLKVCPPSRNCMFSAGLNLYFLSSPCSSKDSF